MRQGLRGRTSKVMQGWFILEQAPKSYCSRRKLIQTPTGFVFIIPVMDLPLATDPSINIIKKNVRRSIRSFLITPLTT